MLDNETIVLHVTRIDGKSYRNDYTVMWRGIGRIRKNPGLPAHIDQWSWGCNVYGQPSLSSDSGQGTDLENCKAKFKIAWLRIRARLTDWDIAMAQKCGEGNCPANAVHRRGESPPKPAFSDGDETRQVQVIFGRLAIAQAAALIVPNALPALAFVHAKGFASARVKHYLNDVGPITAANALELFLSLFAGQLASTKKVHVMLLMGIQ